MFGVFLVSYAFYNDNYLPAVFAIGMFLMAFGFIISNTEENG